MSQTVVIGLQGNFERAFGLAMQYVEVCPEAIWAKKFGGWPVWQQLYHGISAMDFFLRPADAPQAEALFPSSVGDLSETPDTAPGKAEFVEFAGKVKKVVDAYCKSITDARLGENNPGLSKRFGKDISHAATISLLAAHLFYHLGGCDAALRENGLKGVF